MNGSSLYIVSTPIGNLNDMTQRAVDVLSTVDVIAAEDTRHSRKLLNHYSITTPMIAYHDFSQKSQTTALINELKAGKNIALISDAGTPLIADPGYLLVRCAHEENIKVTPIPGACAFVSALSASGLATDKFCFLGFLPSKSGARLKALNAVEKNESTLIFYEAPHRLLDSIGAMIEVFGGHRQVVIAREMTKTFETIRKMALVDLYNWVGSDNDQQKGEIVIVLEGYQRPAPHILSDDCKAMTALLMHEMAPKKISNLLAKHYHHSSKSIYDYIISLKNSE